MEEFREPISHGRPDFPIAAYHLDSNHLRFQMQLHWHPEHEILRVVQGTLDLRLNEEQYIATAGDLFFIQGGTFHAACPSDDCIYECIDFRLNSMLPTEDVCREYSSRLEEVTWHMDAALGHNRLVFNEIATRLFHAMFAPPYLGYELEVKGLLLQFVGHMLKEGCWSSVAQVIDHSSKTIAAVRSVLQLIESDYSKPITLNDMAKLANLSPNYFCRYFKRIAGCSPIDYPINYRINVAAYLLRSTERSISDIALSCGFNDASHFIKFFRRKKGITPKQYRLQSATRTTTLLFPNDPELSQHSL